MKLAFLPEARLEFLAAIDYYEDRQRGLGKRFRAEIAEVGAAIIEHPLLWRERVSGFRRVNCPVFPYYIAYFIRGNIALVAAIAHASRHPDYWKDRIK